VVLTHYPHPRQTIAQAKAERQAEAMLQMKAATHGPRWMTRHYLELRKIGAGVPQNPGRNGLKLTNLSGSEVTSLP
jgi:hypothetical protein